MPFWLSLYLANGALLLPVFPRIILLEGNYTEMDSAEGTRSASFSWKWLNRQVSAFAFLYVVYTGTWEVAAPPFQDLHSAMPKLTEISKAQIKVEVFLGKFYNLQNCTQKTRWNVP